MTKTTKTEGTQIYWTGNMGSAAGYGKVARVLAGGDYYDILMDDGRQFRSTPAAMFSGRDGASVFWVKSEMEARRAAQIATYEEAMARS